MISANSNKWALVGAVAACVGFAAPASAQVSPRFQAAEDADASDEAETQNEGMQRSARTADTGVGEVGKRLTAQDAAAIADPLGRINSRINNRVENRIRNRIDRDYDPAANATSPYEVANRQTRVGQSQPR
ncbi:hypothetical protein [Altererythrobacter aquiaggeris]|uniref:hypothetical protein n=1 Tax=Aestuarierythrobacter aquiaggeris TaxID=1898396 RepID=UPI003016E52C